MDPDETLATATESDPEGTAELYEQMRKVERWGRGLPPEEIEVLRLTYGAKMSLDEVADAVDRPRSTVHDLIHAATEKLQERACESERAAAERLEQVEGRKG